MCSSTTNTTQANSSSRRSRLRSIRHNGGKLQERISSNLTASTKSASSSLSSSTNSLRGSLFRTSSSSIDTELHRRLCPVTGVLREISADYHIFSNKVLGRGHYGMVRECKHLRKRTNQTYAVKSLDKRKISRVDHIRREVYFLHQMKHHGIMKMVDCYEDLNYVHIITEKYTGGELFDKISDNTTPTGCFSEDKASSIIKSMLEAVAYLHDNDIVHRDIKPENILYETDQEDARVKLIDFGLARKHIPGDEPMSNPVGTAYYMSPELLEGKYDKSCDVWSVGTIAYILLCGYPPFNGDTDPEIFESIRIGHFEFPQLAWSDKSDMAKDFIKSLLRMDPNTRLTAKEALMHPWIRNDGRCSASDCSTDTSPVVVVDATLIQDKDDGHTAQHDEIISKIQMLRLSIQRLRKSVVLVRSSASPPSA